MGGLVQYVFNYPDLVKLIEAEASPEDGDDGYVDVKSGDKSAKYRRLGDVAIGQNIVTGTVFRQTPSSKGGSPSETRVSFRCYLLDNEQSHDQLVQVLKKSGINYTFTPPSVWAPWIPMLVISSVILAGFFFAMRRLGGAGSPMAFGRSRGRLYAQEDLAITFDDVAGIDEALDEVKEIVEFLKSPEKYQRLGGRIPKGVLLVGPPGTGKTLLAKAIAGEAGVPFFSLSGSDFVEMFVGVGAARVRDMFQQAVSKAPCIIFIDELDALGKTRGTSLVGGHDEREQTLNALLVEMDGFDSNNGVIVTAATNRPEMLDQALLRPGRFDRQVLVDRPDVKGREDILKVHVKNVKLDPSVNLKDVASISPGFAGADLSNLVNEAALLAARKNRNSVSMDEFNEGVERVTAGLEKKNRIMNEEEKRRVAYHESGHALVAYSLPNTDPVHKVSIIPRGLAALGYMLQRPEGDRYLMTQTELESRIQVLLAGTMAEEIIFQDISTGAQNDLERATEIARSMVMDYGMSQLGRVTFRESTRSPFLAGTREDVTHSHSEETAREIDREVHRIIHQALEQVRDILEQRKSALIALAKELIEFESIDAQELRRIVDDNSPGPHVVPGTGDTKKRALNSDQNDLNDHESTSIR
ncbi:MAG: ATP-dependent zinc metalloprotease FtsH [Planctomycetota bacterium]|nr:ATP-dependent zinc metalloprotease FtsH [Planctomycetota bacterium]MDA1179444.1 ATP-dependent zinc metalloprotease FtsH [Planctomycetota bacterium]